jgi:hypothetical protein
MNKETFKDLLILIITHVGRLIRIKREIEGGKNEIHILEHERFWQACQPGEDNRKKSSWKRAWME